MTARLEALQFGWSEMLLRYEWQWFCTLTFRKEDIHPEAAEKVFRVWVAKLNRELFGNRWQKKPGDTCYWVRATEYQKRGTIHFHVLISCPAKNLEHTAVRTYWADLWRELAGFARIEVIRSQQQVNDYVTKYTAKGGELDFSENLPLHSQQLRDLDFFSRFDGPQ